MIVFIYVRTLKWAPNMLATTSCYFNIMIFIRNFLTNCVQKSKNSTSHPFCSSKPHHEQQKQNAAVTNRIHCLFFPSHQATVKTSHRISSRPYHLIFYLFRVGTCWNAWKTNNKCLLRMIYWFRKGIRKTSWKVK